MREQITATSIRENKAKSFSVVEPFNLACTHECLPLLPLTSTDLLFLHIGLAIEPIEHPSFVLSGRPAASEAPVSISDLRCFKQIRVFSLFWIPALSIFAAFLCFYVLISLHLLGFLQALERINLFI